MIIGHTLVNIRECNTSAHSYTLNYLLQLNPLFRQQQYAHIYIAFDLYIFQNFILVF